MGKYEKTYKAFVGGKSVTVKTKERKEVRELAISESNKKGRKAKKRKYIITSKNTPKDTPTVESNSETNGTM